MKELGRSDVERLFRYYYQYGLNSPWISLLQEEKALARFFELSYLDHAIAGDEVSSFSELLGMRPIRTLEMDEISDPTLFPQIDFLNSIDLRFLQYSTGKLTTAQLWSELTTLKGTDDPTIRTGLDDIVRKLTDEYLLIFMNL